MRERAIRRRRGIAAARARTFVDMRGFGESAPCLDLCMDFDITAEADRGRRIGWNIVSRRSN
jgi:hypothetical protein